MGLRSTYKRCRFWQKKIIFSDKAHFDSGGYVNKQNCRIWDTENPHSYIEKPTHPKRVTVWCRFWSRGIKIGNFSSKMSKERLLQSMAVVIGPFWTNFCSQKLKRRILATFSFNRTVEATLDVLRPDFEDRIISRRADVVCRADVWAAIWHCWTIICGVPSNISVKPTSQRQLTL